LDLEPQQVNLVLVAVKAIIGLIELFLARLQFLLQTLKLLFSLFELRLNFSKLVGLIL
jgi:hypothetical protein